MGANTPHPKRGRKLDKPLMCSRMKNMEQHHMNSTKGWSAYRAWRQAVSDGRQCPFPQRGQKLAMRNTLHGSGLKNNETAPRGGVPAAPGARRSRMATRPAGRAGCCR